MKKRLQRLLRHRDVCQKQRTSAEAPPETAEATSFGKKRCQIQSLEQTSWRIQSLGPLLWFVVNISTNHGEIESHLEMWWLRLYLNRYQLGITAIRERYLLLDSFRGTHFVTSVLTLFNYETTCLVTRTFYKLLY